ncbi:MULTISPECIES: DUF935 domain-containing protein [Marinovum]|uniref:DUF935 domain-containing protein n=1 Tax=Marinovum TaxID=367771 RepID=UPI00065B3071|nr:DUF935 domain-containing protein [Marinovum sp. PR37]AKO97619.1 Mu-like prophage protein gp29 [Marinovum algicola DG 898]MDD9744280.1 DUF935 domain-containing protein [Marinovum sp. PR37]
MNNSPIILDRWGRPIKRTELRQEVAAPTFGGVRSPMSGYPADGLNPLRLGAILREADMGDPVRYLELAETIEERDLHYLGVLGTRKRSVSQIEITVKPGGESALDEELATMVRDWLQRDELQDELFNILDAIGKGFSFTEILWDTSAGQWRPERLEYRDPRWFRFDRVGLSKPMMLNAQGQEEPLPAYKFIYNQMAAKSGLPLRSGLARAVVWGWMFKAYTQRDWAIFTQTYGQPLRVGKFGPGSSETDRDTLFRAVANIAGDCAAIIPESMQIEFVETGNLGSSTDHYERRSDWLDKQVSKAVLGQTATTDAESGGLGSGKEHREVQEDIERADCKALSAVLNRDLVQPWVILERGPQARYPQIVIARPEAEDLKAFSDAIGGLIDRGLTVRAQEVREKFGLATPKAGDEILRPTAKSGSQAQSDAGNGDGIPSERGVKYPFDTRGPNSGASAPLQTKGPSAGRTAPLDPAAEVAARLEAEAAPAVEAMLGQVEVMLDAASDLAEFREMVLAGFPHVDNQQLTEVMAQALVASFAAGRVMVEEEDGG